jgi:hypothetical protein
LEDRGVGKEHFFQEGVFPHEKMNISYNLRVEFTVKIFYERGEQ